MTLGTLLSDLYRRLNYASSPATEVTTRLTAFLNETLQEMLSEPGAGAFLARNEPPPTVASVINQAVYSTTVARIDSIADRSNRERLDLRTVDWYRTVDPDPTAHTGRPTAWVPLGFSPVLVQPTAATALYVVSASAGDTTQTAYVETIRTGGAQTLIPVTLQGLTRAQFGAGSDHEQIVKFYLSAAAQAVSLYTASSGGTLLATIPGGGPTFSRYTQFALWPTPSSVITYTLESERDVADMSIATDEPPFPKRFHRILVDGALRREYEKRDQADQSLLAGRRYDAGIRDWRYFVTCPPDYRPSLSRQPERRSRLGGDYPDGSGIW